MLSPKLIASQLYEYREMIKQAKTKGSMFCTLANKNPQFRREIEYFNEQLQAILKTKSESEIQKLIKAFDALYNNEDCLLINLFIQQPELLNFYRDQLGFLCAKNEQFLNFIESQLTPEESSLNPFLTAYDLEQDRNQHNTSPKNSYENQSKITGKVTL